MEGAEQSLDFALPPVECLGNPQLVGGVVFSKRKVVDAVLRLPFAAATAKVALETAQPLLELRRHELTVNVPDEPLRLWADPERLVQVLSNLLVNAAKYTPVGGLITVSVERQADQVRIRVRDNGIGIPAEKLSEIFRLFSRGAAPMSLPDTGGLGVGLAVARQRAPGPRAAARRGRLERLRAMGGTIVTEHERDSVLAGSCWPTPRARAG